MQNDKNRMRKALTATFVNVPVYDSPCLLAERKVALP